MTGAHVGPCTLFFGSRKRNEDFLYREELQEYAKDGTITNLILAFSREQAHKIYVQDRILDNAELVMEALDKGGVIYVCGYEYSLSIILPRSHMFQCVHQ